MGINTCFETTNYYHTIAYYSHIVPICIALFLSIYAIFKTRWSKLSVAFFGFTLGFSLWLFGSLIDWISQDYYSVYFTWSWLDYINIVFFALGAYFFGILSRDGVSWWERVMLLAVCVPAFIITFNGQSVTGFYQPVCEALENESLTNYKLFAEITFVLMMIYSLFVSWKKSDSKKRVRSGVVLTSILLFFAVFSSTEYIATVTNVYEINLYGLFVLPLFLIVMVFAITNLQIFKIRFLGTQLLVYTLIIMVGSQFLFLESTTDTFLNSITLAVSVIFSLLLLQNSKRELEARIKIEELAENLRIANEQQAETTSFITHQIRGSFTDTLAGLGSLQDGDFGELGQDVKKTISALYEIEKKGRDELETFLRAQRIGSGRVEYIRKPFNLKDSIVRIIEQARSQAEAKGLKFNSVIENGQYEINGDEVYLSQVFINLIDNAIRYTPQGRIDIRLARGKSVVGVVGDVITFSIKDTGVGIDEEDKRRLFTKYGHGKNSRRINTDSNGLGLFIAKNILDVHGGKIRVESEGEGKGSVFFVDLPVKI